MLHSCCDRYGELYKRKKNIFSKLSIVSENFAISVSQEVSDTDCDIVTRSQNYLIYRGLYQFHTFYTFLISLSFLSCYFV
jgi:hypothetical protein